MTSMSQPSLYRKLWYRWKALKLPWRKQWLCGHDLAGNTFWEFKNELNPYRSRRIAKYPSSTYHSDVVLSPAWLQWLRHTRHPAPTIEEQQLELQRQDNLKQLAAQADQRWREQESYLDSPKDLAQRQPLMQPRDRAGYAGGQSEGDSREGVANMAGSEREVMGKARGEDVSKGRFKGETKEKPREEENPWKIHNKGPSEGWQPEGWSPGKAERR